MDEVIGIYSESDSEYDGDDNIPRVVKRENSDIRDDVYEVDPDKNQYEVLIEDVNEVEEKISLPR